MPTKKALPKVKSGRATVTAKAPATKQNLRPGLIRYFTENPNTVVYLSELRKALQANSDESVQAAIGTIIRGKVMNISVVTRGHAWRYNSKDSTAAQVSAPPMFDAPAGTMADGRVVWEYVGTTIGKGTILRDPDGVLWEATRL